MATAIPRIGQRSILNSNLAGSLKAKSLSTVTLTSSEYVSTEGSDIVFNTVNFNPASNNPKGVLEQVRIDNSGNVAYFGTPTPSLNRTITDVSLNLDCFNRITDIYISSKGTDTPFSNGVRVIVQYKNWGSEFVSVVGNVLCTVKNNFGPGYSCIGEFVKFNQVSPNDIYFNTSTTGLTATNGTIFLSSRASTFSLIPYALVFRFRPVFTPISLFTIHIKLVSSVSAEQIESVTVDAPPP
jgi:hypothetical protein